MSGTSRKRESLSSEEEIAVLPRRGLWPFSFPADVMKMSQLSHAGLVHSFILHSLCKTKVIHLQSCMCFHKNIVGLKHLDAQCYAEILGVGNIYLYGKV